MNPLRIPYVVALENPSLTIGAVLFGPVSHHSFRIHQQTQNSPEGFVWCSTVRLDSDRLKKQVRAKMACKGGEENWVRWNL
jgi:hypothetical protein